ncbi:hypothetical protein [Krasilnikovia sp. M28-CT-15]|uniref:hypothetical protein n=1 Tax=Krasilnikovia sp. M28-CT-15 TaxID=3373540 RepID=UPI003875D14A
MKAASATAAELRLLIRSRPVLLVNVGAGLWVLGQVTLRASEASVPVTPGDVLVDLADGVRVATAVAAAFGAAYLLGAHWHHRAGQTLYLAGVRRVETAAYASAACFVLSFGVLGAFAAVGLLAAPLLSMFPTPALAVPFHHADFWGAFAVLILTLIAGSAIWTLVGGALGAGAGSRSAGSAAAMLLFAMSVVGERVAATYPMIRSVWVLSPTGSANVLLTGHSIPDMPQSSANPGLGVAGLACWAGLLWGLATWRSRQVGRGRSATAAPTLRAQLVARLVRCGGGALLVAAMLVSGWLLPPAIAAQMPWRYTYDWRRDEAAHTAPDDVTRRMLAALTTTGELDESYFAGNGYTLARPYVPQLQAAAGSGSVFNIMSSDKPGEVAILTGPYSGEELMVCLHHVEGEWRIIGMRKNLPCQDFLDEW